MLKAARCSQMNFVFSTSQLAATEERQQDAEDEDEEEEEDVADLKNLALLFCLEDEWSRVCGCCFVIATYGGLLIKLQAN